SCTAAETYRDKKQHPYEWRHAIPLLDGSMECVQLKVSIPIHPQITGLSFRILISADRADALNLASWAISFVPEPGQNNYSFNFSILLSFIASQRKAWSFSLASTRSSLLTMLYLSKTLRVR